MRFRSSSRHVLNKDELHPAQVGRTYLERDKLMPCWYCPQAAHYFWGWVDLPSLASTRKREADTEAKRFAENQRVVTRVIRKPHGWEPPASPDTPANVAEVALLHADATEAPGVFLDSSRVALLHADATEVEPDESPKRARKHEKTLKKRPPTWHTRIVGKDPF